MNFCAICGAILDDEVAEALCADCLAVSYSSLQTFQQCPQRWYLEHRDECVKAPAPALVYGSALHATLECEGIALIGQRPPSTLTAHVATFDQCLDQTIAEQDQYHLLAPHYAAMRERGRRHLAAYLAHVAPQYQPVDVEAPFLLPLPGQASVGVKGVIDAITIPQGRRTVVDFKTTTKPETWQRVDENEQATIYLLAEQLQHYEEAANRVTFIVFANTGGQTDVLLQTATRTPEQLHLLAQKVVTTANTIRQYQASGSFPTRPGPLCGWCQVLGTCKVGQQWLKAAGRMPAIPVVRP